MYKLTITFTKNDLPSRVEFFNNSSAAMQFAKQATRDSYVSDENGVAVVYPYFILGPMRIEEVATEEAPPQVKTLDGQHPAQRVA